MWLALPDRLLLGAILVTVTAEATQLGKDAAVGLPDKQGPSPRLCWLICERGICCVHRWKFPRAP